MSRVKPVCRRTGWEWRSPCGQFGIIEIADDEKEPTFYSAYVISPNSVELTKTQSPGNRVVYTVFFGKVRFCGCESFRRCPPDDEGRQTCKHVKALTLIREAGRL